MTSRENDLYVDMYNEAFEQQMIVTDVFFLIYVLRILEIKILATKSTCTGAAKTNLWFAFHCKLGLLVTELILFRQAIISSK